MSLDDAEKAMHEFCRAAWRIRTHARDKASMETIASRIFTAVEVARYQGKTEKEFMEFIVEIGTLTRPDLPKA